MVVVTHSNCIAKYLTSIQRKTIDSELLHTISMDQATTAMRPLLRHAHFQSKFQVLLSATSLKLALESLGTLQLAKVVAQLHSTNYLETMATAVALTSRLTLTKYNLDQSCMLTTSLLTRNLQVRRSTSKLLLSTQSETLPVNLLC